MFNPNYEDLNTTLVNFTENAIKIHKKKQQVELKERQKIKGCSNSYIHINTLKGKS